MEQTQKQEKYWYSLWEENGYFKANPSAKKKHYSLLMPPPNLTGELHLGHAMQHSILDAIARFKRLQGYDVLLLPGVDHAGIQFEGTLNKLLAKEGLSKQKMGREEWLRRAWEFRDKIYQSFHATWTVMGVSADWSREVFTLDEKVRQAVFTEFKTFWEQDLLYKGAYIVQWCPKCGTAIEDVEMEYEERKEKLYFVNYAIADQPGAFITVATVRPETIFADTAIAMYPHHPKFAKYKGMQAINPLTQEKLAVIEDERVDKNFGTGALKITPGHDLLDYQIGKDLGLPILHAIDKTGRMTELARFITKDGSRTIDFFGIKAEEARIKTAELLQEIGALAQPAQEYVHAVPICERSKNTVEPLVSEEWFVTMKPLAEKALKNLHQITFSPKNYRKIIADWLENIHDWSISRSLWWGHRIPVWYCKNCNQTQQVGKDKNMIVSLEKPTKICQTCGKHEWIQDEQVLDTWFSSGMWPLATLGWPENTEALQKYFPWDFEISAPEIKYLWIARMIMLSLWFKNEIPFNNMFFHGMIRDMQGRKFSKSLGNGIDPNQLRQQWGTDAVRMALYSYSAPGRDARSSRQVMDERCKSFRNFETKLKNITRFIIDLKPEKIRTKTSAEDTAIKEQLLKTIKNVSMFLNKFELHLAIDELYQFVWHEFADIYIEQSKKRREEAQETLEYVLQQILILLHPFMPFTTEELYQKLPKHKASIMLETWPEK